IPRRFAVCMLISLIRTSNSRCRGVCGTGMNSSLDTDWTGMGEGKSDSADESFVDSLGESMLIGYSHDRNSTLCAQSSRPLPVISRAPRSEVKYDHSQPSVTTTRLRKPIRKKI